MTTQPCGQIAVVNGPARHAAGLNFGMGALGPGTRGNATIGRALRLLVSLTGEGMPGRLDRSTLGQPGKVGVCLAEDEARSPWPPLHVERGFPAEASVVTMFAGDAPLSISEHRSRTPEELAAALGWAAATLWSINWWPLGSATLFVICPEHADTLAAGGWGKAESARRDLGGRAAAGRRASPRRDDRTLWPPRPTTRSCPSGTRPTTSC